MIIDSRLAPGATGAYALNSVAAAAWTTLGDVVDTLGLKTKEEALASPYTPNTTSYIAPGDGALKCHIAAPVGLAANVASATVQFRIVSADNTALSTNQRILAVSRSYDISAATPITTAAGTGVNAVLAELTLAGLSGRYFGVQVLQSNACLAAYDDVTVSFVPDSNSAVKAFADNVE